MERFQAVEENRAALEMLLNQVHQHADERARVILRERCWRVRNKVLDCFHLSDNDMRIISALFTTLHSPVPHRFCT